MPLPIAVQLYSVRNELREDFRGTLEKVKAMGYDGVEFAGLFDHAPEDVRQMCAEIGLIPISAHRSYADLAEAPDATFATYAKIGTPYIAIAAVSEEYRPGHEKFEESIGSIRALGEKAKKYGLQLLYHNHDFEFAKVNGSYGLDILYREIPAEILKTEIDTCWVAVAGEDPAAYVRKYAGRAPLVHLKDFWGEKAENMYELIGDKQSTAAPKRPEGFEFRPVGSGKQNMPAILAAAKDAGASWVIVEQDKPSMGLTALQSIEKSIGYLKSLTW